MYMEILLIKLSKMEHYLTYPIRWLAKLAKVEYDGEFRNACAAHLFTGWALSLSLGLIYKWLFILPIAYAIYRELEDCKFKLENWNSKNTVDEITFQLGNLVGIIICLQI